MNFFSRSVCSETHRHGAGDWSRNRESHGQDARQGDDDNDDDDDDDVDDADDAGPGQEGDGVRAGPQDGGGAPEAGAGDPLPAEAPDHGRGRHQDGSPLLRRLRRQRPLPDLLPPHLQAAAAPALLQVNPHPTSQLGDTLGLLKFSQA